MNLSSEHKPDSSTSGAVLDVDKAMVNIGDMDTIKELLLMMHEMLVAELPQAQQAFEQSDYPGLRAILHRWNGSLGHFVSDDFALNVQALERSAHQGEAHQVSEAFPSCYARFLRFCAEITDFTA